MTHQSEAVLENNLINQLITLSVNVSLLIIQNFSL